MQIRTRLTLQFLIIGTVIMILASASIYYFSAKYRQHAFNDRLRTKATLTSNLLLETNAIGAYQLEQLEKRNPLKLHNEKIIILTLLDDTLFTTDDKNEIEIRYDILENIRSGRQLYYRQGEYEVIGSLYHVRPNERYVVIAAAIDREGFRHLEQLRTILIIVCLMSFIVFIITGWIYSGQALKPISGVINQVDEITITSLNLRLNEGNGKDEMGRLAKTFNKMLERLETSFDMQKDFIANASHELRTPLTSMNGQLDVLLMKDRNAEEYKSAATSVLEDIRSLIDLANRLLLIARTSAEGPVNFTGKIRVDEILWQAREETMKFNKNYHVKITLDPALKDADQMNIAGDESLLKVAMSNLIDNACKYSENHSVDVRITQVEKRIDIIFEDKGIGIPQQDIKKVLEPFYRSKNAMSYTGSGIGLPLVKQIVSNHNGKLDIFSTEGKGTKIVISLPIYSE
jgi:signal transduction histidine kinase